MTGPEQTLHISIESLPQWQQIASGVAVAVVSAIVIYLFRIHLRRKRKESNDPNR